MPDWSVHIRTVLMHAWHVPENGQLLAQGLPAL
jgi:hypothetical protein